MSTQNDLDLVVEESRVEWLILADEAEVVNGKLYMMGGGWDRLTAQSLPWRQHMTIAVAIRVPWMETNRQTQVEIDLQDGSGNSLAKVDGQFVVGRPAQSVPGQPLRTQIAIKMDAKFQKLGTYVVVCRLHGAETTFPFSVVASPQLVSQLQDQAGGGPAQPG